ncbi:glycosyltransferase family 4 protein [Roseibacillus ishigakijimensis]|uniref:Glycosyltransferase family 4 protein n=1 Tax=Roseibacillus ishigakijimensis TaxID=454146 RepID=A0A934RSH5_9BACT|nr:glycosyltransferase family 4 protein [Roseibacillus ishigakijimensis]MBK1833415.1 glycosyltransferase family 4 protein [Roseibacillus ishigakijimensis]
MGILTETFIKRYAQELQPEGLVTLGRLQEINGWEGPDGKTTILEKSVSPRERIEHVILRKLNRLRFRPYLWSDERRFRQSCRSLFKEHEITTVFSQYLHTGIHMDPICKELGLRHVVRGHGYDITQIPKSKWGQRNYHLLSEIDCLVVPTPYQSERLGELGISQERIHAIPYGVELPDSASLKRAEAGDEVVRCLSVGRFTPKKAPEKTLRAFIAAAAENARLSLTMIGDGPLFGECKELAERSAVRDRISLLGARPNADVKKLMASADLFLQHSITPDNGDQEGAPVAIMEAMAFGLPVVSTRHSGIPYQVDEEVTGLLVDEGDISGMSRAISELAADKKRRKEFGVAGRAKAEAQFTWKAEKESILKLCR